MIKKTVFDYVIDEAIDDFAKVDIILLETDFSNFAALHRKYEEAKKAHAQSLLGDDKKATLAHKKTVADLSNKVRLHPINTVEFWSKNPHLLSRLDNPAKSLSAEDEEFKRRRAARRQELLDKKSKEPVEKKEPQKPQSLLARAAAAVTGKSFGPVHEKAVRLYEAGIIDEKTMLKFDEKVLEESD